MIKQQFCALIFVSRHFSKRILDLTQIYFVHFLLFPIHFIISVIFVIVLIFTKKFYDLSFYVLSGKLFSLLFCYLIASIWFHFYFSVHLISASLSPFFLPLLSLPAFYNVYYYFTNIESKLCLFFSVLFFNEIYFFFTDPEPQPNQNQ